ncbi:MAG: hypothetical protein ACYCSA_05955 [Thermoplasmataceae archaeon]
MKDKLEKGIRKVVENPEVGKTLNYVLKVERTVRIPPFSNLYNK